VSSPDARRLPHPPSLHQLLPVLPGTQERPQPATRSQRPDLRDRLVGRARLGRIDLLVFGRVDAHGGVGGEHEIPTITHPPGVNLGDARVFPLEVLSPGEEVALGAGGSGHGLIHPMRSISPRGWDGER